MRWLLLLGLAGACGDNLPALDTPVDGRIGAPIDAPVDASPVQLVISPETYDYGIVTNGQMSAPHTFQVTNLGGTATAPLMSSLTGADGSHFEIGTDVCTAALPAGASCTVVVSFGSSSGYGARTARLRVADSGNDAVEAVLDGTTPYGEDILQAWPSAGDFGSVGVGQTSASQAFVIVNAHPDESGPVMIYFNGTDPTQFALVGSNTCTGMSIPGFGMCTFSLAFIPTTSGHKEASLYVTQTIGPGATIPVRGDAL